ncbi:hypothetical protein B9Z55_012938 [Caenorhabditis nigoni]|uniref:Uncharacterized protein n=1 Tax=Caenorhabditis nigoni TaxID=1611254 RepID=A0A2G5TZJ7_9PELO|nr:hypothetical protein B9Z55_012938 [Caenorhabditis nigoni]
MELPVHTGPDLRKLQLRFNDAWIESNSETKLIRREAKNHGYVRIIHQSSPKFIPRYFAHFDISIPCCTTNCCLSHISY